MGREWFPPEVLFYTQEEKSLLTIPHISSVRTQYYSYF